MAVLDDQLDGTTLNHGLVVAASAMDEIGSGGCLEGFVRDDARLAILGYTHVGENHPGNWRTTVADVQSVKDDPADVVYHGLIDDIPHGCGWGSHSYWEDAVNYTGGLWFPICDDVAENLLTIGQALAEPERVFTLSAVPVTDSIVVSVAGNDVDDWTWDAGDNAVEVGSSVSVAGDVDIDYDITGDCTP
jgi:hypothetical protein